MSTVPVRVPVCPVCPVCVRSHTDTHSHSHMAGESVGGFRVGFEGGFGLCGSCVCLVCPLSKTSQNWLVLGRLFRCARLSSAPLNISVFLCVSVCLYTTALSGGKHVSAAPVSFEKSSHPSRDTQRSRGDGVTTPPLHTPCLFLIFGVALLPRRCRRAHRGDGLKHSRGTREARAAVTPCG